MPELPEVQTIVSDLQSVVGEKITGFESDWPKALQNISVKKFLNAIKNKEIRSVERAGKYIAINLDRDLAIIIHLRMTGKLLLKKQKARSKKQEKEERHIHHKFHLKTNGQGQKTILFSDVRKFATISLYGKKELESLKNKLGIDPLGKDFTLKNFTATLARKPQRQIKDLLMDQTSFAGIGNIYASEIMYEAQVSPHRKILALSNTEMKKIYEATKKIIRKAVSMRGTSISDYRDAAGKKGDFQHHLNVYKKHTQKCKKCGTIIEKSTIGQRSTFYCPKCQK